MIPEQPLECHVRSSITIHTVTGILRGRERGRRGGEGSNGGSEGENY